MIDDEVYVTPLQERLSTMPSILMPTTLLKDSELALILQLADFETQIKPMLSNPKLSKEVLLRSNKNELCGYLPYINEALREYLPLRDIKPVIQKEHYQR